jgi:hypothetical protein
VPQLKNNISPRRRNNIDGEYNIQINHVEVQIVDSNNKKSNKQVHFLEDHKESNMPD